MLALLLALRAPALAAGLHAGIPVAALPELTDPSFFSPDIGWVASLPGGQARIYVGRDAADGARWYHQQLDTLQIEPPRATGLGDACAGDGEALFGFVDGNVGVLVLVDHHARAWAERLHGAIADGPAWPAPPTVRANADGSWSVLAPDAVRIDPVGTPAVPFHPDQLQRAPTEVIAWDRYGRPAIWRAGR